MVWSETYKKYNRINNVWPPLTSPRLWEYKRIRYTMFSSSVSNNIKMRRCFIKSVNTTEHIYCVLPGLTKGAMELSHPDRVSRDLPSAGENTWCLPLINTQYINKTNRGWGFKFIKTEPGMEFLLTFFFFKYILTHNYYHHHFRNFRFYFDGFSISLRLFQSRIRHFHEAYHCQSLYPFWTSMKRIKTTRSRRKRK